MDKIILEERNGRPQLPKGKFPTLLKRVEQALNCKVDDAYLRNWCLKVMYRSKRSKRLTDGTTKYDKLTEEHLQRTAELKAEFPKDHWPAILRKLRERKILPKDFRMSFGTLRKIFAGRYTHNKKHGAWSKEEETSLMKQFHELSTSVSNIKIRGRSYDQTRNKIFTIIRALAVATKDRSLPLLILDALQNGIDRYGNPMSRDEWMEHFVELNPDLQHHRMLFAHTNTQLVRDGRVVHNSDATFSIGEPTPRAIYPPYRRKPRLPLLKKLRPDQVEHLEREIVRCKQVKKKQ